MTHIMTLVLRIQKHGLAFLLTLLLMNPSSSYTTFTAYFTDGSAIRRQRARSDGQPGLVQTGERNGPDPGGLFFFHQQSELRTIPLPFLPLLFVLLRSTYFE